jgi:hypothetical protein
MIAGLKRRLAKVGLLERVEAGVAPADSLGLVDLRGEVDFTLAMAVVHEMPSARANFFGQAAEAMEPGSTLLLVEPAGHVEEAEFQDELMTAAAAGCTPADRPSIRRSHTAVLKKVTV